MAKMLPARTKYRKAFKGTNAGLVKRGGYVAQGDFGMQAMGRGKVTARQIEACRVAINRQFARKGQIFINIFPHMPVSKKPAETRMGKGKGAVDHYVAVIKPGKILFEVAGVKKEIAQSALRRAAAKLNIPVRFVERVHTV